MIHTRHASLFGVLWMIAACGDHSASRHVVRNGGDVDLGLPVATVPLPGDAMIQRADSLVRAGRPWRATALLAGRLASPATASPELRLAGARAAAAWDGWSEVERLLRDAPWLDAQFGGEGRELLARSALERGTDALADARLALRAATEDVGRLTRRVLLGRAYDRANLRDSASAHYLAAASRMPSVADWLRLRAAGVTGDSAQRAALFARVSGTAARARIGPTEAQARERSGDLAGAARAFRLAGAEGAALRVEALASSTVADRSALAQRIVHFLARSRNNAEARQAIDVLDNLGSLSRGEEVAVARAAAAAGLSERAVTGFTRATMGDTLAASDRMVFAGALGRVGRGPEAVRVYGTITHDAVLAPLAAYQSARMLLQSGAGDAARGALRDVAGKYATSRDAAAPALLLLADLQVDDNDVTGAAQSLRQLIATHPAASQAPLARFRLGLLEFETSPASAAQAFDSLVAKHPADDEAVAARYWAGRAYARLGRNSDAKNRWQGIIRTSPLSYYAVLAARRLHVSAWSPPTGNDTAPHVGAVDSAVQRITALRSLGMDVEARFEVDAIADRAERVPTDAATVAQALSSVGEPARALRVALAAINRGSHSLVLYRNAYPLVHDDALVEESRRNELDPALVAGLIRQESSWNPHAISPASARGLMQLMPSVGASLGAARRYPLWNPALLFDPDVSIELGTAHLSASLRRSTPPERALAAYNAGASRVARWIRRPGADDPETFAEWIPFTETRDYVRVVLRNAAVYRALYKW